MTTDKSPDGIIHHVETMGTLAICGARTVGGWLNRPVTCVLCIGTPFRRQCGHKSAVFGVCPYAKDVQEAAFCECCDECAHECSQDI